VRAYIKLGEVFHPDGSEVAGYGFLRCPIIDVGRVIPAIVNLPVRIAQSVRSILEQEVVMYGELGNKLVSISDEGLTAI